MNNIDLEFALQARFTLGAMDVLQSCPDADFYRLKVFLETSAAESESIHGRLQGIVGNRGGKVHDLRETDFGHARYYCCWADIPKSVFPQIIGIQGIYKISPTTFPEDDLLNQVVVELTAQGKKIAGARYGLNRWCEESAVLLMNDSGITPPDPPHRAATMAVGSALILTCPAPSV